MELEVLKYLHDVLESIDRLLSYSAQIDKIEQIEQNEMLKDAIERRLSIVGDALYQANKINNAIPISNKAKIFALRHIIVHDDDSVNPAGLYIILKEHLALLHTEVKSILHEYPPDANAGLAI